MFTLSPDAALTAAVRVVRAVKSPEPRFAMPPSMLVSLSCEPLARALRSRLLISEMLVSEA